MELSLVHRVVGTALLSSLLLSGSVACASDGSHASGGHTHTTLFAAEISADDTLEGRAAPGTATAACVLDATPATASLDCDLTFHGLATPPARITLRNFGEGGMGDVVHVVCGGADAAPCPEATGATLTDRWSVEDARRPLDPAMVREVATQRIYLEIEVASGSVRGQLETSPFMVPALGHVVRLAPTRDSGGPSTGTGAVFLTRFGDGTQHLDYLVTVTGLSSPLLGGRIVDPSDPPGAAPRELTPLVGLTVRDGPTDPRGGTLAGTLERGSLNVDAFRAGAADREREPLQLLVLTVENPDGELVGNLEPVE